MRVKISEITSLVQIGTFKFKKPTGYNAGGSFVSHTLCAQLSTRTKRTVPIEKLLITYNKLPAFFSQQQSRIDYHEHRTEAMPQCSGYRGQNTKG